MDYYIDYLSIEKISIGDACSGFSSKPYNYQPTLPSLPRFQEGSLYGTINPKQYTMRDQIPWNVPYICINFDFPKMRPI